MSERLTPCPACSRHVKLGDCSCPFCGAKVACAAASAPAGAERMSRAAFFAAGALGTVVAATDCGGSTVAPYGAFPPPIEAGADADKTDAPSTQALDGSAAPSDAAAPGDAGDEQPRIVPPYGGPPYGGPAPPPDAADDGSESG